MRHINSGWLALLLALALLSVPTVSSAETVEVAIRDYAFEPAELRIKAGTTVVWSNRERRVSHSILFLGEGGFESERIFPGESWQHTFTTPGTFTYSCGPHPGMRGTIIVANVSVPVSLQTGSTTPRFALASNQCQRLKGGRK